MVFLKNIAWAIGGAICAVVNLGLVAMAAVDWLWFQLPPPIAFAVAVSFVPAALFWIRIVWRAVGRFESAEIA